MGRLITAPSPAAQWQHLVADAELYQGQQLDPMLEGYLVMVLLRFTKETGVTSTVLGVEYLQACDAVGRLKRETLRDVADTCLLVSGLFPGVAERRHVSAEYYVHIGQGAYGQLAALLANRSSEADLYDQLEMHFQELVTCLQGVRLLGRD